MLSVKSLLNPAPPGQQPINQFPPSPASSSPSTSFADDDSSFLDRPNMPKPKMPKDAAVFNTKSRPKGLINFYPYERLDGPSLREVQKFQVRPLGKIQEYCRHIPYNSGKKDFYVKTGRESFEVFQYVFKAPEENVEYVVMWDYNIGLVRMTPFFKCCKYPKTTPAKMLNANPGLKEITHSITGGSIMAQGYWMPYLCAKAVCATFCQRIAGALIPIFGSDFPSLCTPADTPEYSRMVIDPAIVAESTREAELFRQMYNKAAMTSSSAAGSGGGRGSSPRRDRQQLQQQQQQQLRLPRKPYGEDSRNPHQHQHQHPYQHQHSHIRHSQDQHHHDVDHHHHLHHHHRQHHHNNNNRIRKAFVNHNPCDSPYGTDTEAELSPPMTTPRSSTATANSTASMGEQRYLYSPPVPPPPPPMASFRTHSGWTPANIPPHYEAPGPSPWLSAVPRLAPFISTNSGNGNGNSSSVAMAAIASAPPPPAAPTLPPPQPVALTLPPPPMHHPLPLPARAYAPPHPPQPQLPPQSHPHAHLQQRLSHQQQQQQQRDQQPHQRRNPQHSWRPSSKRSADHIMESSDYEEYDGGDSGRRSTTTTISTTTTGGFRTAAASPSEPGGEAMAAAVVVDVDVDEEDEEKERGGGGDRRAPPYLSSSSPPSSPPSDTTAIQALGADKNAAMLLMNLSVRDSIGGCEGGGGSSSSRAKGKERECEGGGGTVSAAAASVSMSMSSASCSPRDGSFPRIKRIRSNSM